MTPEEKIAREYLEGYARFKAAFAATDSEPQLARMQKARLDLRTMEEAYLRLEPEFTQTEAGNKVKAAYLSIKRVRQAQEAAIACMTGLKDVLAEEGRPIP